MWKQQQGVTLVELLATLVLLTLVAGGIWTAVSIASKFSTDETTTLRLQQEANYVITELERIHRKCSSYDLVISESKVSIADCKDGNRADLPSYNGVISQGYSYKPIGSHSVVPSSNDLDLSEFTIGSKQNSKRSVKVPTILSRYKTD